MAIISLCTKCQRRLYSITNKRVNHAGLQMLPLDLYKRIFGKETPPEYSHKDIERTREHLLRHGLYTRDSAFLDDIALDLPQLEKNDVKEHFWKIGKEQAKPYYELARRICVSELPAIPEIWIRSPGWTKYTPGCEPTPVAFPDDGVLSFDVEVLQDAEFQSPTLALALGETSWYLWCSDFLCSVNEPSQSLSDMIPLEGDGALDEPRLVIGHNVAYDRSFVREQYSLEPSKLRFLDTMSMHICLSGLTSEQRLMWKASEPSKLDSSSTASTSGKPATDIPQRKHGHGNAAPNLAWINHSSPNGLSDVHRFYCGAVLDKGTRDIFVKGTVQAVRESFQECCNYCAKDVLSTKNVLYKMLPLFIDSFPHPVTFAAMLQMGQVYLPTNHNWTRFRRAAESSYDELQSEMKRLLIDRAEKVRATAEYKEDLWLWDLDWTMRKPVQVKLAKGHPKQDDASSVEMVPQWYKDLLMSPNRPDYTPGPCVISAKLRIVPKLLKLTWDGHPVHYSASHGWGYLVARETTDGQPRTVFEKPKSRRKFNHDGSCFPLATFVDCCRERKTAAWSSVAPKNKPTLCFSQEVDYVDGMTEEIVSSQSERASQSRGPHDVGIPGVLFFKLPHKGGYKFNVGTPLAKEFLHHIEEGTLTSEVDPGLVQKILQISKETSYWQLSRKRVLGQQPLQWHQVPHRVRTAEGYSDNGRYGAIVPRVISSGTITRRAVEATWMTASNSIVDRVGSELKAMVQAPPGYHLVGADVDSEELWIASLISDSSFTKTHGGSAIGWMTLRGNKSEGTDLHSMTAKTVGVSREHAKVLNYGRIYGAGAQFTQKLLLGYNKHLTKQEALHKAKLIFKQTKGVKLFRLTVAGNVMLNKARSHCDLGDDTVATLHEELLVGRQPDGIYLTTKTANVLKRSLSAALGVQWRDVVVQELNRSIYYGGTESHMFNALERTAVSEDPVTPVLGCKITTALKPCYVNDEFMMSRVNWVVQSSGVDYLHLLLVSMNWLIELMNINARFCISIHDEVRYLVVSEDRYRLALALQLSNLLTRCMFSAKLKMDDLPMAVAFFSSVDVDTVLRKEVDMDCVSPSNPEGLRAGYGVDFGESLNIYQLLKKLEESSN